MPLYGYFCEKCDAETEVLQSFSDPAPKCCGDPMTKGLSNIKTRKGAGLYSMDTPGVKDFGDLK